MTKLLALEYCKVMRQVGFMTHVMILDIYQDDEEIPDGILDLVCYYPRPQPSYRMYLGSDAYQIFNEWWNKSNP